MTLPKEVLDRADFCIDSVGVQLIQKRTFPESEGEMRQNGGNFVTARLLPHSAVLALVMRLGPPL